MEETIVSEVDDTVEELDDLVRKASVPSLATLYDRGKKSGLITPVQGYHAGTP